MITYYNEIPAEPAFSLLRGLFPVCEICSGPGLQVLQPAIGIVIQLVNASAQPPAFLTDSRQPIISYGVNDLQKAIDCAIKQGAIVVQPVTDNSNGFCFCYLQFPDAQPFGFFTS